MSFSVHALPSLHEAPSGAFGFEQAPVAGSHVPATWHASLATHGVAAPVQTPDAQESFWVQTLPSSHEVPSGAFGFVQTPVLGSQLPAAWQASLAEHVRGLAPMQRPPRQVSLRVHGLLSLQAVPSGALGFVQVPVDGSHDPARWHGSEAVQRTGLAPVHVPDRQVSFCVQAFPSLQLVPSGALGFEQVPVAGLQAPAV